MTAQHHVTVHATSDVREFLDRAGDHLRATPVVHSVILTVAERALRDPESATDAEWYLLERGGHVAGVAMHTPPRPPHLPLHDDGLAVALARHLMDRGRPVHGVGGLKDAALAFADLWCEEAGLEAFVEMDQGMYDLPVTPRLPWPVAGALRVAGAGDLELVEGWLADFHEESVPGGRVAVDASHHVVDGRVALWEDEGRPVSMCYASVACAGVTRISGVWTPRSLRGRGYASAVVARWSRHQQEVVGAHCMLYTDLANPTSNGIYQAIGYRRVGDGVILGFDPNPQE